MNLENVEEICNAMTAEECADVALKLNSEASKLLDKFAEQFKRQMLLAVEEQLPHVQERNRQDDQDQYGHLGQDNEPIDLPPSA